MFVALLMAGCSTYRPPAEGNFSELWGDGRRVAPPIPLRELINATPEQRLAWRLEEKRVEEEKAKEAKLQQRTSGTIKNGKPDGLWKRWYENGRKESEAEWKDGELVTCAVWKPDGAECPLTDLVGGNGIVVFYHSNGQKASEGRFRKGVRDGAFTSWDSNGTISLEVGIKDGRLNGIYTERKKGQKTMEGNATGLKAPTARHEWEKVRREFLSVMMVGMGFPFDVEEVLEQAFYGSSEQIQPKRIFIEWADGTYTLHGENPHIKVSFKNGYAHGVSVSMQNGLVVIRKTYKDGFLHGLFTYGNGDERWEAHFKEGKPDGAFTFKEHMITLKEGKADGPFTLHMNGKKGLAGTFRDGKLWTANWKPNGEKSPVGKIVAGNGVLVWYGEDGTEKGRWTYKDGVKVED